MRIAFIVPDNRDEFRQFDSPRPVFGPAPQSLLDGFAQLDGCEIHVISLTRNAMAAPPQLGPNLFFHLLAMGPFTRLRSMHLGATLKIRSLLRQIKADVAHGQGSERYPAVTAAFSGIPNVVTIHGIMTQITAVEKLRPFSFEGITAFLERRALRRTDSVICLTNHAKSIVSRFNQSVSVIPNAIPERFFEIRREPAPGLEIICPAHIYHLKNQHGLIEALDPLAKKIGFTLTLLGKVSGDSASQKAVRMAAERPWCRLAGMADQKELAGALSRASLLVLPSFEENCPMAILEGMAVGIPIAASRAGGIPDLIEDEVTGLLFDPRDPVSIGGAIERMLMNTELAQKLAAAGRRRAEMEFRTTTIAARHLEFYRALLKRS